MSALDAYLAAWAGIVSAGYSYCNDGPWRCTGERHCVDCSGGVVLALNRAGVPTACTNSFSLASMCWDCPRPAWMTEQYGAGVGTQITMDQAKATPGAWGFHGNNGGRAPDASGDGHIKTSIGGGKSVEAMSHAYGVGYGVFDNPPGFITYCALPPMLLDDFRPAPPKVAPMYDPALPIVAALANPQGGAWMAQEGGEVWFVNNGGSTIPGGMISPHDRAAFAGRKVARLEPRRYGPLKAHHGYTIVAQSGEKYVPEAQH